MKFTTKKLLAAFALAGVLPVAHAADIKLGVAEALSGGAAQYGISIRNGFQLAADEINAAGGINGNKIVLVIEDEQGKKEEAINVFKKLIFQDKVLMTFGPTLSNSAHLGGYPYSRHSLSVAPIAGRGNGMQRDYWYVSERNAADLAAPEAVGRYAAERALSRLSARRVRTGKFPVLFEAPLALGLLGALTQATNGGALYRKASFLLDSLGKGVLADHIDVKEDPHVMGGMGSSPFDDEGVRTQARDVVVGGVLQGYFLSTYTARKLGMPVTGNAGGSHNLTLTSRHTQPGDDLPAMLRKMGTGFLVTELIGQGVNYVTGDYSRGAFGYWVENGVIQHAVEEVTIAGNMLDMFKQIVAVGADTIMRGTKCTGSILIEQMAIAGEQA